jgi:formylglycine-generating enzyme required for sulfatase activity
MNIKIITFLCLILLAVIILFFACEKKTTAPEPGKLSQIHLNAQIADGGILLTWTISNGQKIANLNVFRSDLENGDYSIIAIINSISFQYLDTTVIDRNSYWYRVSALNAQDNEINSSNNLNINFFSSAGNLQWVSVPAGDYTYGTNDTIKNITYNYQVMKYPVTNQQYLNFLEDALSMGDITIDSSFVVGPYNGDEYWASGDYEFLELYDSDCRISYEGNSLNIVPGFEDHPVLEVTWFGAYYYAKFYSYRLPTENEWEKAARSNTGWDYPYGNNIDNLQANFRDSGDPFDNGSTPVGYYDGSNQGGYQTINSQSPFGAYDMAGNTYEWCNSINEYQSANRIIRGGSWSSYISAIKCTNRNYYKPLYGNGYIGFRCVRD